MTGNFTEIELTKVSGRFEKKNNEVRAYYLEKLETDHELKIRINELVEIVHDEHKDWSFNKIAHYIWVMNQDLDGFSKSHVNRNLTKENRILLHVQEPKPKQPKQPKKSLPSELLEEFRQQKGKAEEDEEEETKLQNNVTEQSLFSKPLKRITKVPEESSRTNIGEEVGEAVDSVYDLEDNEEDAIEELHVIYDDPEKLIRQYLKKIQELTKANLDLQQTNLDLQQANLDLERDYERVIPPYEVIETNEIDEQEHTQIIHVDPYNRTAWTEPDQQQRYASKLNKGRI